jgi:hypothetical protein
VISLIVILVICSDEATGQDTKRATNIVVNGHSGQADTVLVKNREYIDLRALARIANGSIAFQDNQIILTLPEMQASNPSPPEPSQLVSSTGLSQEFVKAGIEEIALMREWASPIAYALHNGYPITEEAANQYRAQAASGLKLAQSSVKTDADRNAFQLLNNEFEALEQWSNKLIEARKTMDTAKYAMSENALRDDPLSQKIIACGHFLSSMLGSGTFQDDPSCH